MIALAWLPHPLCREKENLILRQHVSKLPWTFLGLKIQLAHTQNPYSFVRLNFLALLAESYHYVVSSQSQAHALLLQLAMAFGRSEAIARPIL